MQYLLTEEEFKQRRVSDEEIEARIEKQVSERLRAFDRELLKALRDAQVPSCFSDPWPMYPGGVRVEFAKWLQKFLTPAFIAARGKTIPDPTSPQAEGIK